MKLLLLPTLAAVITAGPTVGGPAGVSLAFDRASADNGDRVTIDARGFRTSTVVRLYLVRSSLRTKIRSAADARLAFVGNLRPRAGRALTTFEVPPLDSAAYVPWCRGCGTRATGLLQVTTPPATTETCPVTVPKSGPPPGLDGMFHGNGALWTGLAPDGVLVARPDQRWPEAPQGSIGTKLFWFAAGVDGVFTLSGRRLDAPSPSLDVLSVNRGTMTGFRGSGTWATAVTFPSVGCWKLTARLRDFQRPLAVNLSYVVKVEQR